MQTNERTNEKEKWNEIKNSNQMLTRIEQLQNYNDENEEKKFFWSNNKNRNFIRIYTINEAQRRTQKRAGGKKIAPKALFINLTVRST